MYFRYVSWIVLVCLLLTDSVSIETQVSTATQDNIQWTGYITTDSNVLQTATVVYTFDADIVVDEFAFGNDQGDTHGTCIIDDGTVTCQREVSVDNFFYIHFSGHISDCHKGIYTLTSRVTLGAANSGENVNMNVQNTRVCTFLPALSTNPGALYP